MNITTDRLKKISMIPYFQTGQAFVVKTSNPNHIMTTLDLCGQPIAAESNTTEANYLQATGDQNGKGLPKECNIAGKQAPTVILTQTDTDALQQLLNNQVIAYATDSPIAAYYTLQHSDQFEMASMMVDVISEGIGIACGTNDCTNATFSSVGKAVQVALKSMIEDGTYTKILTKWNLTNGAVKSP
jgi:polar amino acid transport system substrate-binding protein